MIYYGKKTAIALIAATLALGGCATVDANGNRSTSTGQSAGLGAIIGAVAGVALGGNAKSAAIGAALGGGIGYLVALDMRKKELEEAKVAAADLERTSNLKPVVLAQTYEDTKTGNRAEGLKAIEVNLPISEMTNKKGELTPKGIEAMVKLQAVADKTGPMEVTVPSSMKAATFAGLSQAAPRAKIVVSDDSRATARIYGKPVENGVRTVTA